MTASPESRAARRHALGHTTTLNRRAPEGLLGLGGIAAARHLSERAATLAGAALASSGEPQPDMEQRIETEFLAEARARIGIEARDAAAARGAAMTIDEAIDYALQVEIDAPRT